MGGNDTINIILRLKTFTLSGIQNYSNKMSEFNDSVITVSNEKILPVAAIYGAIPTLKTIDILKED